MNQWAKQKQTGFTIVELLIVVVVIAILAAITIVSYNGITTRANNTTTVNAAAAHVKAIQSYASENGVYPTSTYSCLGPAGLVCSNTTDTTGPAACGGMGQATTQTTYLTQLSTIASNLPQPSTQGINCGGKVYRGGWYYSASGTAAQLVYFLKGAQSCQSISGLTSSSNIQADDITICRYTFPTL